jgi:hypothetical protein
LRDRLSDSAAKSGRSISEEIEARLKDSYEKEDLRAEIRGQFEEWRERILAESDAKYAEVQAEIKEIEGAAAMFDAFVGDDYPASKEAARNIVVLLVTNPNWESTAEGIQKIKEAVSAAIDAAAKIGGRK